jgi:hypothetical protein
MLFTSGYSVGWNNYFTWVVRWRVAHDFGTAQESWTEQHTVTLAFRSFEETDGARLSISVTDINGDGEPELILHLTRHQTRPDGTTGVPVIRQMVGYGLCADGSVRSWDSGHDLDLPFHIYNAPTSLCILGDLDLQRLGRMRTLGDQFQQAAVRHQACMIRPATAGQNPPAAAGYQVAAVTNTVIDAVDPSVTIPAAVAARVSLDGAASGSRVGTAASRALLAGTDASVDPLRHRFYEPQFPQPMAEPLRELFPDLVYPAVDGLPEDSVALLVGNTVLIVAYLAGLNHELGRELLWRGYPSSGRATWFRNFFDTRGAQTDATGDIAEITGWGSDGDLASKTTGPASTGSVILVVRGELLRRYPDVVIQAVRGVVGPDGPAPLGEVRLPAFTGRLGPDVSLFSFPIPETEVRGEAPDPGWYFVFAEAPTGPRFSATAGVDWTAPGGHSAAAMLRMPVRLAVRAADLLPPLPTARNNGADS